MKSITTLLIVALFASSIASVRAQWRTDSLYTLKATWQHPIMKNEPINDTQDRFLRRSIWELMEETNNLKAIAGSIQAQTRRMNMPMWQEWWFIPSVAILITGLAMFLIWYNAEQKIRVGRTQ